MTLETQPASDPAAAAPDPAPQAPEGADLMVKTGPHDEAFWDQHPDVDRYRVPVRTGQADAEDWAVLVWLRPEAERMALDAQPRGDIPQRPADATFVIHAAHDVAFFERHPGLEAWRADVTLNEDGPGAVHHVEVWMRTPAGT